MTRGLALTLGTWLAGAAVLRATVLAPEGCAGPGADGLEPAAREAVAWMGRAQRDDGTFLYEWDAATGTPSDEYNEVRHAGVTMSLYQRAALAGDAEALAIGDRGLGWMLMNLERGDGWVALRAPGADELKLGASALMAAALIQRRDATGEARFDDVIRGLGRFQLTLLQGDRSLLATFDIATGAPVPGATSKYATGESLWALAMTHNRFPGEGWDVAARAVADYLALERDEAEDFDYPPWADQWAAYGLAEMAGWGLDDHHIRYARALAGRFGLLVRSEMKRRDGDWSLLLHGRMARAAGMGTWVEGLTGLWQVADSDPRLAELRDAIAERAQCGASMLVARQVNAEESLSYLDPGVARGAWFSGGQTRMDDQQHALSGIILTMDRLANEGSPR